MKVLHIIPTLGSGGAEKMLVDIVEEMHEKNISVEVLVLSRDSDFYSEEIKRLGVTVHFGKTDKIYHPSHIMTVRSFVKKDFEIIHTHLYSPQLYVALANKTTSIKAKLITTEHSTSNRRRGKKIFEMIDNFMYNQYDKIIAITKGTGEALSAYHPSIARNIVVIENGIKIEQYKNAVALERKQLIPNYCEGDILVLMVAAMRQEKNHEAVIRASKLLPNNFHVIFVGDGGYMKYVQSYAHDNGSNNIHFFGRRSDVPEIMKACDIFVLPSHWEGFGLVAVEAMASGLPVIASDVDGLKEVVSNGGILMDTTNSEKLAEEILFLANETDFRVSNIRNGASRAELYSIQVNVQKQVEIYQILLND